MPALNERIRNFYNHSTPLWLNTWGEHMHHGFYGFDGKSKKDDRKAQKDLIDELLKWGNIEQADRILDAGCGVGGSARYLSAVFNADVTGFTLSNIQAEKAAQLNKIAGTDKVNISVRDMMTLKKDEGQYDLIWSLESAEHVEDKKQMLQIFYDHLNPGSKFIIATWCIRNAPPPLNGSEKSRLNKISSLYHLPPMISMNDYISIIKSTGFKNIHAEDWTIAVAPFWKAVIRSALKWKSVKGLLTSGLPTIKGAWAMRYMRKGFRKGTLTFVVLQGQKL
ncbi:MAG: methyltransferase domain-containing protein [Chitinophagales bacterium]